jgi:hypothetical protein
MSEVRQGVPHDMIFGFRALPVGIFVPGANRD